MDHAWRRIGVDDGLPQRPRAAVVGVAHEQRICSGHLDGGTADARNDAVFRKIVVASPAVDQFYRDRLSGEKRPCARCVVAIGLLAVKEAVPMRRGIGWGGAILVEIVYRRSIGPVIWMLSGVVPVGTPTMLNVTNPKGNWMLPGGLASGPTVIEAERVVLLSESN